MSQRLGDKREMPDVPKFDFVDALSEIWFQISFAAYHMAYVRVYSQSEALRVWPQALREQDQEIRDHAQIDIVICRSHLAAFFWHVEHVFEALKTAITRGQKELPSENYFWAYEKRMNVLEELPVRQEIKDYRNMAHQTPAIIGCRWDEKRNFLHHFLPTISGHTPQEDVELNLRLQQYFEFAANMWLEFAPGDFKDKFSRDFRFPVTVPLLFVGELPEELKGKPQLEVQVNSYDSSVASTEPASEEIPGGEPAFTDPIERRYSSELESKGMVDNWFKAEVAFACPHCGQRSSEILFANASRHDPNAVARGIQEAVAPLTCRRCKKVAPAGMKVDIGMNDLKPEDVAKENLPLPSQPPFDPAKPCPCGLHGKSYGNCCKNQGIHVLGNAMLRGTAPITVPGARTTISSSMVMGDIRFRFVWNTLWQRPQTEPFDQFLDALVYATLGTEWFDEQAQRAPEKRHAIAKWREAMVELRKRPPHIDDGFHIAHTLTGPVKAYQCFGYDLYWLQLFHKLPASLIERLKDFHAFQGARYEVLIAAIFARAGFDIEWIDDDKADGKHPEFIATHRATGRRVGVEAKSRKRSGSVNYPGGEVKPETHLKGDVFDLYEKAIQQSPEGRIPFLIFIDANVPDSPPQGLPSYDHIPIETAPWMVEIRDRLVSIWAEANETTPESGVMVTNFPFYYGDNESPSPTGMGAFFPSPKARVPILGDPMLADLEYCLRSYDMVPRQI